MSDIKSIVFDEIALEGLDGITIRSLWVRLEHRKEFKFNLDHSSSKAYIWKNVVIKFASNLLKFYSLPKPRSVLQIYNRYDFISQETGHCLSNENQIPDDECADVCPISENNERGSCKYYKERTPIPFDDIKDLTLDQLIEAYGDKLVIVANQLQREIALRLNYSDPEIELSPIQYCMLERVGRCRTLGEITFGKESANYKDQPKTLFYFRKILLKKKLITKQNHTVYGEKTLSIIRGLLLMLPRFHIDRKSPIELAAHKCVAVLKTFPDNKCEYSELRSKTNIKPKPLKHVFSEFNKNFRVFEQEVVKNCKKIRVRFVQLVKNLNEDDENSDSDENEEPEEDEKQAASSSGHSNKLKLFSPENIVVNRPLLSQSYDIVDSYNSLNGCSLREFQNKLKLPRLDARMLIRMLERLNEVTSITTHIGKQKIIRYFLKHRTHHAVTKFNNENNQLDLGKKATLITLKRANLILDAVKAHKIIDQMVFFKKIILEAEKNLPYQVDAKSIRTIVSMLAREGHVNWIKRTIEKNNQVKEFNLICIPSIKEDDEDVQERLEQAKFNSFSMFGNQDAVQENVDECEWFHTSLRNDDVNLVYQPSAGRKYGLEPKMKRLLILYKFIFFTLSDECKKKNDYDDWRKHITPLPKSYEKDICLLGDLVPRMPLSIFVKVVFITFIIPGLDAMLSDPERCNLTLQMLPTELVKNLFRKRKYLFSMVELLTSLAYLKLVEVNNSKTHLRESVSIKLIKTTQFEEDGYVKNYRLETTKDVDLFINDLAEHSSKTDCKNCSFDSRLYIHNARNWSFLPKLHRDLQIKEIRRFERLRNVMEGADTPAKSLMNAHSSNLSRFKAQPSSTPSNNKRKSRSKTQSQTKRRKTHNDSNNEASQTPETSVKQKKPRTNSYDKEDLNALSLLRKQRSEWSSEEDSFLLMCRVASVILNPQSTHFICVSKKLVRDELNKYLPELAFDKTSKACQRRIMYMLRNPRTKAHVLDWVEECKQDPELSEIKKPNAPITHEEVWNSAYISLLHKLLKKFQNEHFMKPANKIEKFRTLDEIYQKYNLIESEIHCVPQKPVLYFQPNNIVDIYVNVVLNVIASSLLTNLFENSEEFMDKSALALFKIYQRYPDTMIRAVVNKMKQNGMMAKMRDSDRIKMKPKNRKLALYKISQHYCYVLKSRYSMDLLSTPLDLNDDLVIDSFKSTDVALLTNLITLDRACFSVVIPENFISYKETHMTKPQDSTCSKDLNNNLIFSELPDKNLSMISDTASTTTDQMSLAELNKRASRYVLCSVRQKMDLVPNRPLQTEQDFIILNKCNVTCRISKGDDLVNLDDFFELVEKQNVFVQAETDYLNEVDLNNLEKQIVKEVMKTKELGLNYRQLNESLKSKRVRDSVMRATIRKLCDQQVLFKVGVEEERLVTRKFVNPWLVQVHSIDNEERDKVTRKHVDTQPVDDNPMEVDISTQTDDVKDVIKTNTTEKQNPIYFQPKFWKTPFGQLDKRVMVVFLSGILGHVMANPGITNEDLISYFKFCLPPVQTNEFIDLLVAAKCIEKKEQVIGHNYTLFDGCETKTLVYYEPTKQAFITICAIKNLFSED